MLIDEAAQLLREIASEYRQTACDVLPRTPSHPSLLSEGRAYDSQRPSLDAERRADAIDLILRELLLQHTVLSHVAVERIERGFGPAGNS